jgi:general secretion pathway protein J
MKRAAHAGFTLIEVLVALLVMAIMAALAWQGVDGIVRARDASQQRLELTLRMNTVIGQWEQDLAALQETASVPPLSFDGATLRLTRRTPGGVQLVAWSLRNGDTGSEWQRWASPSYTTRAELQDTWLRSQQFQGGEPGQLRALSGVSQWQIYFFRGNAWSNAQSSADVSPPTPGASAPARQILPSGVRLVLGFAEGSGVSGSLTRDTLLNP